jgi:putative ABC transport system ATP-binding protein
LITHNTVIASMADRVVQIADGKIASIGTNARRTPVRELAW